LFIAGKFKPEWFGLEVSGGKTRVLSGVQREFWAKKKPPCEQGGFFR
jgi:hypothetical protein